MFRLTETIRHGDYQMTRTEDLPDLTHEHLAEFLGNSPYMYHKITPMISTPIIVQLAETRRSHYAWSDLFLEDARP